MFDPPESMHVEFERALGVVRGRLGADHPLYINGLNVWGAGFIEKTSPIRHELIGRFSAAGRAELEAAVTAAARAHSAWRGLEVSARVALMHRVAQLIEERVYLIAAALCLEVGKNRLEALAETQETADFFKIYADEFQASGGFDRPLPDDPLPNVRSRNRSVLKSHGVWAVVAPFNFPLALAGGPTAAALVTGNTVVLKGASDAPWATRLLADCIADAGVPPGVFNLLWGQGSEVGAALCQHPNIAGLTFTGSYEVGMSLCRHMVSGAYVRPCIAEMGGKNACIVTESADLDQAVPGIIRSAFGLGGQKCSALSRLYVEASVMDKLAQRLIQAMQALAIGDPTQRQHWLGPLISERAVAKYESFIQQLHAGGAQIVSGGSRLVTGELAKGCYVAPTLAAAAATHPLMSVEMFAPILMMSAVPDVEHGVALANDTPLGLTAGIYGSASDVAYFLEHIEAGTLYVNRQLGATTGAWPGYQAFTGWKGSGSTNKGIGSFYYLSQYLREQSQTVIE